MRTIGKIFRFALASFVLIFFSLPASSQQSGQIIRACATTAGRAILDQNSDGYTSKLTSGFNGDDVSNSEIEFKSVPSFSSEPYGDIRRGPDRQYTDFVPDANNRGYYTLFTGPSLLFRFRVGTIIPGSKGYSVLLDTDEKFGSMDPNYQAATTGTNGNPGFEIEIVFETNFRIAIYNVDGTSTPTLVKAYTNFADYSQISVAGTSDNADPDFFIDFYIPFSDLSSAPFNLTASSPVRMIATTVMSPQAAIGGPKSDIYGLSDDDYQNTNDQYVKYIQAQKAFTFTDISSGGSGVSAICTSVPTVSSPITAGVISITGQWNRSTLSTTSTAATITVYKNNVSVGTVSNVASGDTWTLAGVTVVNGDEITAKAQVAGESMCLSSNKVLVRSCTPSGTSTTTGAAFSCSTNRRGLSGTRPANSVVRLYTISAGGTPVLFATDAVGTSPSGYLITYSSSTAWEYNHTNNSGSVDPCSGGPNDMPDGSYYFTITESGKCESAPIHGGCMNQTTTATPTLAQTAIYNSTTSINGTAAAGVTIRMYVNGSIYKTITATTGSFQFDALAFATGDSVVISAQAASQCISTALSYKVNCNTQPPVVNSDANGMITAGSAITGLSSEPAGTPIQIYSTPSTLVGSVINSVTGTWTTSAATTTPAPFTATASVSYFATAKNGTCATSTNSSTVSAASATHQSRCGSVSGTISALATSISGNVNTAVTGTTVRLYLDGTLIGSTTTGTTAWGPIPVNTTATNTLYANGVLSLGIAETGKQEVLCPASSTISCGAGPGAPALQNNTITINANQSATFSITNGSSGVYYGIIDANSGQPLSSGLWATNNGTIAQSTSVFTQPNTYNLLFKATSLNGLSVCASATTPATVVVQAALPVVLIEFRGRRNGTSAVLQWKSATEEKLKYYILEKKLLSNEFTEIAKVLPSNSKSYQYTDEFATHGNNQYRLKMVDDDESYEYSNIVVVDILIADLRMVITPNPTFDFVQLKVNSTLATTANISITDAAGRELSRMKVQLVKGAQTIPLPDVNRLAPGTYNITLLYNGRKISSFFVKQ